MMITDINYYPKNDRKTSPEQCRTQIQKFANFEEFLSHDSQNFPGHSIWHHLGDFLLRRLKKE